MSGKSSSDWEAIVRRASDNPDSRVPMKDKRDQAFKLVAELILDYARAPHSKPASAKALRARGEYDRAAREVIAARVRQNWGNDAELEAAFFLIAGCWPAFCGRMTLRI